MRGPFEMMRQIGTLTRNSVTSDENMIKQACAYIEAASSILFITGAGISAESGLPTYRGVGGLYNNRLTEDHIPIEVAISGQMLALKPEITWTYLAQMELACRGATFNEAHRIIAEFEHYVERSWVLTQNVDGFHRAAGSRNVIDIHGDLHYLSCLGCPYSTRVADYADLKIPPVCPECSRFLRPDVVLFGEYLPEKQAEQMQLELARGFDLIFTIGTSNTFAYIHDPVAQAAQNGIPTIEINPDLTCLSDRVALKFTSTAVETLTAVWTTLQS